MTIENKTPGSDEPISQPTGYEIEESNLDFTEDEKVSAGESISWDEEPEQELGAENEAQMSDPSLPENGQKDVSSQGTADSLSTVETVYVTDDKGRKEVKVDFNDREKLKKLVQQAYGMRKFQKERDDLQQKIKQIGNVEEATQKVKFFDELDSIYQDQGERGLINRLAGDEKAFDNLKTKIIEEYEVRRKASPDELTRMDLEQERNTQKRMIEKLQEEQRKFQENIQAETMQAEMKRLESAVNTTFDKYRFAGKIGDVDQEYHLDTMVFKTAQTKLAELAEQGVEVTSSVIDQVMRETVTPLRKYLNTESRAKLKTAINQQKDAAASNVQAQVKNSTVASAPNKVNAVDMWKKDPTKVLASLFSKK